MARIIGPQTQGKSLTLRGPANAALTITLPDGSTITTTHPNGVASVTLEQAGAWAYAWDNGPSGEFIVAEPIRTKPMSPPRWN